MTPLPTHYERLGLPGRFAVDVTELERAYLESSREVHPDYHVVSGDRDESASAALNEAYTTLRDPFRRAEYLLQLGDTPAVAVPQSPAFLTQAMELRERLEESRGDDGTLWALDAEVGALIDAELAAVAGLFAEPTPDVVAIRNHLNAWKTLASLRRSIGDAVTD